MKKLLISALLALTFAAAHGQQLAKNLWVNGTAGTGYVQFTNQSVAPGTPTSSSRIYFDSSNRFSWIGTNGFTRSFDGTANTANRIYVLPDVAGTVALSSGALTSGRVPFATTGGILTDVTGFTFASGALVVPTSITTPGIITSSADGTAGTFGQIISTTSSASGIGQIQVKNSSADILSFEAIGSSATRYGETGRSSALYMVGQTNASRIIFAGVTAALRIGSDSSSWTQLGIFNGATVSGNFAIAYTTEATTGAAGSINTAGGIYAAKKIINGSDIVAGGVTQLKAYIVSGLPAAASYAGGLAYVTDATATTRLSTVAGGGSNKVIVFSDGTNWLIL